MSDEQTDVVTVTCDNLIEEENEDGELVENECGWEWDSKSDARRITCPSCQYKIRNPKYE